MKWGILCLLSCLNLFGSMHEKAGELLTLIDSQEYEKIQLFFRDLRHLDTKDIHLFKLTLIEQINAKYSHGLDLEKCIQALQVAQSQPSMFMKNLQERTCLQLSSSWDLLSTYYFIDDNSSFETYKLENPSAPNSVIRSLFPFTHFFKVQKEKNTSINDYLDIVAFSLEGPPSAEIDLPADLIIGGIEIFSGVLLCIIPTPYTEAVGLYMIYDGIHRGIDGLKEIESENQKKRSPIAS